LDGSARKRKPPIQPYGRGNRMTKKKLRLTKIKPVPAFKSGMVVTGWPDGSTRVLIVPRQKKRATEASCGRGKGKE
jgi:hypothetical protein